LTTNADLFERASEGTGGKMFVVSSVIQLTGVIQSAQQD
jgi:hypothetical protein